MGNIGLIYMKKGNNDKCIEYSTQALAIIDNFMNETKTFSTQNTLEVKILLRRSKSYDLLGDFESCKKDIERILLIEPKNTEASNLLKGVQLKLDGITFNKYKEEANVLLKKKEF